jgi:RsiW-degrading membrane proteinase PrsW (M82 family)
VRCDQCANDVPDGVFCTRCGAHQGTTGQAGGSRRREHRYAANPAEHVVTPSVFSTIFPHLGHHKLHEFRWAFWAGLAGVALLAFASLISAAILVAIFLVPVLYLVYLYEAQVYRDEPAAVIGFTIGGGVVAAIVLNVVEARLLPPTVAFAQTIDLATFLVLVILIPLVQETLKPLPALVLRGRVAFPETADGLVFGIAAGLGFSVADSLIRYAGLLTSLPLRVEPAGWIYVLLTLAVFQPLLQGTTTGAIMAAIWRGQPGRLPRREVGLVSFAVAAHIGFSGGSLLVAGAGPVFVVVVQGVVVGALLICIRYVLHHALLEEGMHMGFAETVCANCHRHLVAAGFCPSCGMALAASPSVVKLARRVRATAKERA